MNEKTLSQKFRFMGNEQDTTARSSFSVRQTTSYARGFFSFLLQAVVKVEMNSWGPLSCN